MDPFHHQDGTRAGRWWPRRIDGTQVNTITKYEWLMAVMRSPQHRDNTLDLRAAAALMNYANRDSLMCFASQQSLSGAMGVATDRQFRTAKARLADSHAIQVRPIKSLPEETQKQLRRNGRGVVYFLSRSWAYFTFATDRIYADDEPSQLVKGRDAHRSMIDRNDRPTIDRLMPAYDSPANTEDDPLGNLDPIDGASDSRFQSSRAVVALTLQERIGMLEERCPPDQLREALRALAKGALSDQDLMRLVS